MLLERRTYSDIFLKVKIFVDSACNGLPEKQGLRLPSLAFGRPCARMRSSRVGSPHAWVDLARRTTLSKAHLTQAWLAVSDDPLPSAALATNTTLAAHTFLPEAMEFGAGPPSFPAPTPREARFRHFCLDLSGRENCRFGGPWRQQQRWSSLDLQTQRKSVGAARLQTDGFGRDRRRETRDRCVDVL
jgi:hypothetical protein